MRVFVTGVAGFLGQRLARRLLEAGAAVGGLVLDAAAEEAQGLSDLCLSNRLELFEGDLGDALATQSALSAFAPEVVIHLGALSHVGTSWRRIPEYFRVNVLGTENVVAGSPPESRLVFASSAEIYGCVSGGKPVTEEAPALPASPYAMTKAAAERLVAGRAGVIVRSFNLVGPGQSPQFALPSFARQLCAIRSGQAEPVISVGNLSARRDFLHVDDGVDAYLRLVRSGTGVYNLASGEAVSIAEALQRLIAIAEVQVEIQEDPALVRPVDAPLLCGDSQRLRQLGWQPERGLDQALTDLWRSVTEAG